MLPLVNNNNMNNKILANACYMRIVVFYRKWPIIILLSSTEQTTNRFLFFFFFFGLTETKSFKEIFIPALFRGTCSLKWPLGPAVSVCCRGSLLTDDAPVLDDDDDEDVVKLWYIFGFVVARESPPKCFCVAVLYINLIYLFST